MLADVFLKAVLQQFSGILDIENEQLTKLIYFKNGNVVFVESNDREETFGHYLMRKKLIDPKSLDESLQELITQKDLKLGEILLKRGLIDPNSLMIQLNLHQEEKLFNTFNIKTGSFRFISNTEWPEYVSLFPFRTLNVYFSAIEKFVTVEEMGDYAALHTHAQVQLNHQPSRDLPLPPFATRLANGLTRNFIEVNELAIKLSVPSAKVMTYLFIFKLADWISVLQETKREFITDQAKDPLEAKGKARNEIPPEVSDNIEQSIVEKKLMNPAMQQRLQNEHDKIGMMNFYQLFGVGAEFTPQQIQVNFFQIISDYKRYEEYDLGKEIVQWIKTAYDVLRDPKLRLIYDYRFSFRKKVENIEKAEKSFYRAVRLLEKKDFENALYILRDINEKTQDSTFRAYLAWAIFQENPQKSITNDVTKYIDEAFKLYPADPFAHYIAGQVETYRKNLEKADTHFRSALQVFPKFNEAAVALDSLKFEKTKERMESSKDKDKDKTKGFFDLSVGGFSFGKKE